MALVLLQVGQGNLEYATLERVVGVLHTARPVDERLADTGTHGVSEDAIDRSRP